MPPSVNPAVTQGNSSKPDAVQEATELFAKIMECYPKQGISASSFGKYNDSNTTNDTYQRAISHQRSPSLKGRTHQCPHCSIGWSIGILLACLLALQTLSRFPHSPIFPPRGLLLTANAISRIDRAMAMARSNLSGFYIDIEMSVAAAID